jgi:hypothetical protein
MCITVVLYDGVPPTLLHLNRFLKTLFKHSPLLFDIESIHHYKLDKKNTTVSSVSSEGSDSWGDCWIFLNKPIVTTCSWSLKITKKKGMNICVGAAKRSTAMACLENGTGWDFWKKGSDGYLISYTKCVCHSTSDEPENITASFDYSDEELELCYDVWHQTLTFQAIADRSREYTMNNVPPGLYPVVVLYGKSYEQSVTITSSKFL